MTPDSTLHNNRAFTLADLPLELILHVARHLSAPHALRLAQTSRHFHAVITDFTCRRHVQYSHKGGLPLWWAVVHNNTTLARRALDAGADPDELVGHQPTGRAVDRDVAPLWIAANNDDMAMVQMLLDYGADISGAGISDSPLMVAARGGHADITRVLLEAAQKACPSRRAEKTRWFVNARDRRGQTALFMAAAAGHDEICRILLSGGARLEARTLSGMTPLHQAVTGGRLAVVKTLLAAGADALLSYRKFPSSISWDGGPPERNALDQSVDLIINDDNVSVDVRNTKMAIFEAIVSNLQRETTGRKWLPVDEPQAHRLLVSSSLVLTRVLLRNGLFVDSRDASGSTPLISMACLDPAEKPAKIHELVTSGANVNAANRLGTTALMLAALSGPIVAVEMLLSYGASLMAVDSDGQSVLFYAARFGDPAVVELLLSRFHSHYCETGSESDHGPRTIADLKDTESPRHIHCPAIQKQLNIETSHHGMTPLMQAIRYGCKSTAQLFIANGADIHAVQKDGLGTLSIAAIADQVEVAKHLIEHGLEVDQRDDNDWTPLMHAASSGSLFTAELLIKHGADVHAVNEDSAEDPGCEIESPFHLAVMTNNIDIVSCLKAAGVDPPKQDGLEDLIAHCYRQHWREMVLLLQGEYDSELESQASSDMDEGMREDIDFGYGYDDIEYYW